jgi:hypothetical protein
MAEPEKPSAAKLIGEYIRCRNSIAVLNEQHERKIAPYKAGMELIENLLTDEINRLEGQSIKTEHGTAYRSTVVSYKVADRDTWFDWVFANNHRDMLTANVAKEAIKEFMETNGGTPPPALNMTTIYKTLIRSPDNG